MRAKTKKVIAVFVILGGVLVLALSLVAIDESAPDVSDLQPPKRKEIPDAENAYVALMKAASLIRDAQQLGDVEDAIGDAVETGEPFPAELGDRIRRLAVANTEAIAALDAALVLPDYQSPPLKGMKERFPVAEFKRMARIIGVHAWFEVLRGRNAEAMRGVHRALSIGSRLTRRPESLVEYLLGLSMSTYAAGLAVDLASRPEVIADELASMEDELAHCEPSSDDAVRACQKEYQLAIRTLDEQMGSRWTLFVYKRNRTRRELATLYRGLIQGVRGDYGEFHAKADSQPPGVPSGWRLVRLYATGNVAGEVGLRLLAPPYLFAVEKPLRATAFLRAARIVLALRSFKARVGTLPQSLDELVPLELDRIPVDPFDGQPMRYSREKRRVYSIGPDLHDDGGKDGDSLVDDPTLELRF